MARLNLSTAMTVDTEIVPLDESFSITADGLTEQWYYQNTAEYSPDWSVTPLTLSPTLQVHDKDSNTTYTPDIADTYWYVKEFINGTWEEYLVTEAAIGGVYTGSASYYKDGHDLKVRGNIASAARGVTIRCRLQYNDPRDTNSHPVVEASLLLSMNEDADVIYPELHLDSPSGVRYNPLEEGSSERVFKASMFTTVKFETLLSYYANPNGTEQILPVNDDAVTSLSPILDIRYGVGSGASTLSDQTFVFRKTANGTPSSIPGEAASITSIQGQSVVWNQYVLTTGAGSSERCTFVKNGDNDFTYTKTANNPIGGIVTGTTFTKPQNHTWYTACYVDNTNNNVSIRVSPLIGDSGVTQKYTTVQANSVKRVVDIFPNFSQNPVKPMRRFMFYFDGDSALANGASVRMYNFELFDLTLMFGAGNEPETAEEFEAWLAANVGLRGYYPYDGGTILSVKTTGIKTTGFNQWDEEWVNRQINVSNGQYNNTARVSAKNFIKIIPDTTYHFYCSKSTTGDNIIVDLFFYTNLGEYIGYQSAKRNQDFTPPEGAAFMKFTLYGGYYGQTASNTYNHDVCINISDPNKNGTYEPYQEYTGGLRFYESYLGVEIRDFPLPEMFGLPTGVDSLISDNGSGYLLLRCNKYKMSDLTWQYDSTKQEFYSEAYVLSYEEAEEVGEGNPFFGAATSSKYAMASNATQDKTCFVRSGGTGYDRLCVKDSSYSTVEAFEASLSANDYVILRDNYEESHIYAYPPSSFEWYGVKDNVEVKIDTLPCYVSGQGTDTLTIDAMYGDDIQVVLRARDYRYGASLLPMKIHSGLAWELPRLDCNVYSENGQAVRSDTEVMSFGTIVNAQKTVLTEAQKNAHLRFKWKSRPSTTATQVDRGWGQDISMSGDALRVIHVDGKMGTTVMSYETYLLGPYEALTYGNEDVTDGGAPLFGRTIE